MTPRLEIQIPVRVSDVFTIEKALIDLRQLCPEADLRGVLRYRWTWRKILWLIPVCYRTRVFGVSFVDNKGLAGALVMVERIKIHLMVSGIDVEEIYSDSNSNNVNQNSTDYGNDKKEEKVEHCEPNQAH
mgnify:CR=1 FL=1